VDPGGSELSNRRRRCLWTDANAQAVIEVSASRIVLAPMAELDVATLTETAFQATLPQGEVYLHLQPAAADETYAVQTPRGLVTLAVPGRYGILAGDTQNATLVTVIEGSARIEGPGVALDVGPNQTASIAGTDNFQGGTGPAQRDAFLAAMLNSERPPQPQGVAPPPVVADMPGGYDLAEYGSWADTQDYGQVWYPQVGPDWVPYRDGSWSYVAPWGWTWIDAAPWGFAPFHYGRWATVGGRWCWVPGGRVRLVYAPALVAFVGLGAVAGVGIGGALAERRVGWVPLGPHEPFHPWYHASDRYVRQINVAHITNGDVINRNVTNNNFVNRGAATAVPAAAMAGSRPVATAFQRVDPAQLTQARPVIGQQPLAPASATHGVTPAVARQFNLPPPAPGLRPAVAGPALHPGALPALRTPGEQPIPAVAHPSLATPALRPPPVPGQAMPPAMQHGSAGGAVPPAGHEAGVLPPNIQSAPHVATAPPPHVPPPAASVAPPPHNFERSALPPPAVNNGATVAHTMPFAAPPRAPEQHMALPQVHTPAVTPPPPVVNHPPPPVMAQSHPPPPVAQFHPPPAPAPAAHAPPPPTQNGQHKRPGEQ